MVKPAVINAFLFFGDDSLSKEKAINDLVLLLLGDSSREFNLRVFHHGEADSRHILDFMTTVPFLAQKRIAIVRDIDKWPQDDITRLTEYIRKPAKTGCIILETRSHSIPKEFNEAAGYADCRRFGQLNDAEFSGWLKRYAVSRGMRIEDGAIRALQELQIKERSLLAQELDKLASFIGDTNTITESDVEKVVGRTISSSAFDLVWAVGSGRMKVAVNMVSDLISFGRKPHEIIGILCWHLKRILKAKMLKAKGRSDTYIARYAGVDERYLDEFTAQVRYFDIPKIQSMMEMLLEADSDIKRTKFDPALILDFAIIRLCLGRR